MLATVVIAEAMMVDHPPALHVFEDDGPRCVGGVPWGTLPMPGN